MCAVLCLVLLGIPWFCLAEILCPCMKSELAVCLLTWVCDHCLYSCTFVELWFCSTFSLCFFRLRAISLSCCRFHNNKFLSKTNQQRPRSSRISGKGGAIPNLSSPLECSSCSRKYIALPIFLPWSSKEIFGSRYLSEIPEKQQPNAAYFISFNLF